MNDMFGIRYSALSGLNGASFTQHTGLRPALTNSALSGLSEVLKDRTGSDHFFNPKLELNTKMIFYAVKLG
jgi:hypothetical protein